MTRLDILLLAIPEDGDRANLVLDGLHEAKVAGVHPARIEVVDPQSHAWRKVAKSARSAPAVLFCWSNATAAPEIEPLRNLATELKAKGTALSVELDHASAPLELRTISTYPAYGWRCKPGILLRFLFGDVHRMQIAIAAQRKVSGQDPPPPAAFWQMLRGRAWLALVGIFAFIGIFWNMWSIATDDKFAQLMQPEIQAVFESARNGRDCVAMRSFVEKHPGSSWSNEATEFLANCHQREEVVKRTDQIDLPLAASSREDAESKGRQLCEAHTKNTGGVLRKAELSVFDPAGLSAVRCTLVVGVSTIREVYGSGAK